MQSERQSGAERAARMMGLFVALAVVSITVRYNSFIPWGTDSGAYLNAAHRWADADLYSPQTLVFRFPWAADANVETPFGHRPGDTRGTYTSLYPLGYPLLLAAALKLGGELAPYVVGPICAGVLAWCAFLLGRAVSGPWAGVIAAALIAATPITLTHAVIAMSDVPATAFWALGWVMSVRAGYGAAVAAGACTAMAMMIRPNLGPLAIVMAASMAASQPERRARAFGRVVAYGATAAIGPAVVMWSQAVLYGGPLNSGYPQSLDFFFDPERIPFNARIYVVNFVRLHTWLPFTGLSMIVVTLTGCIRRDAPRLPLVIVCGAVGIMAVNYALYLAYLSFEDWQSLRFMLPAMLALFVLFAATLDQLRRLIVRGHRWLAPLAALPAVWVALTPRDEIHATMFEARLHLRLHLMGRYLHEALPRNTVILTYLHGGAVALYTGRPIIRMDTIGATALDRIVGDLQRGGFRPALVIDHAFEYAPLAEKFNSSPLLKLDWRPRAEFATLLSAYYLDISDRDRFFSGDGGAVDVVLRDSGARHPPQWVAVRPPGERFAFPALEETAAFRTLLERTYQTDLGRSVVAGRVDGRTAVTWMRRYLRYRLHGCDHSMTMTKVFDQIDGAKAQPLCARPAEAIFPPRDQIVDFRRQLEAKYPAPVGASWKSSVDLEGEALWVQEYLQRRLTGCSHDDASDQVRREILGAANTRRCGAQLKEQQTNSSKPGF